MQKSPACARRFHACLRLLPVILAGIATSAAAPGYDYFLTGNPADAKPAHTTAGLLLAGGGTDNDDAFRWFVKNAGGGDIVILRASGKDGYNDYVFTKIGGVDSVETLLFHDRSASADPRVLEIIAHADGIFLAGGDQSKYVRYWKGTPVGAALASKAAWARIVAVRVGRVGKSRFMIKDAMLPLLKGPANELTEAAWATVPRLFAEADRAALTEASLGLSERLAPKAKAALDALPAK
jgi:hypothetical protein